MKRNLVMAYFENGGMLDLHFKEWAKYPQDVKDGLRIVITDDCSQRDPAIAHFVDCGIETQLYHVDTSIDWNWDGARNLAIREGVSAGEVLLMTDMDHLLSTRNAESFLALNVNPARYYVPARVKVSGENYKRHPNSWIMTSDLFWKAGGYCEDFQGLYGKDRAFRRQVDTVARRVETDAVTLMLFGREDIPDASTVDLGRKDTRWHTAMHPEKRARTYTTHIDRPTDWCRFAWHRVI